MDNETKTIEQYDEESMLSWNFYPEELGTMRLLGIRTIGDLLRRYGEWERTVENDVSWHTDAGWDFLKREAVRLGVYKK